MLSRVFGDADRLERFHPGKRSANAFLSAAKKLYDVKPTLPQGVVGPNVNDEYGDVDTYYMP